MSPLAEARLVFAHDLRRRLLGPRGIVLATLALLLGGASTAAVVSIAQAQLEKARAAGVTPAALDVARRSALGMFYSDADTQAALLDAPLPLVVLFWLSVWLAPALVWLVGYDAIAGELQGRTLRYAAPRVRREAFYVGKAASTFASAFATAAAMHGAVWIVLLAQGSVGDPLSALLWGVKFLGAVGAITAAWTGVAVLASGLMDTSGSALLAVAGAFAALFFTGFLVPRTVGLDPQLARALLALYPNGYDAWLLSPELGRAAAALLGCLTFAAAPTAAGAAWLARRDI